MKNHDKNNRKGRTTKSPKLKTQTKVSPGSVSNKQSTNRH
jgi:hypothetical protein